MRNRLILRSKNWLIALCLLISCGLTYSCSDNYDLDTTMPPFLGGSIYSELKAKGEFNTVVRLIDDLNYAEVLDKTGSKTMFVANDDAFKVFFANNPFKDAAGNPVTSYEQLSQAQKKLLLNGSMLDNAYLTEMLANVSRGSSLVKNVALRQSTAETLIDSVPFVNWANLPKTQNKSDIDFWHLYNVPTERNGIYLLPGSGNPMMLHFVSAQMNQAKISKDDFQKISGQPWTGTDVFIYNAKVLERDITCLNGYINKVDRVLLTPPNLAELIRTNGSTNIFSRLLDRFSLPVYDAASTALYRNLHQGVDSVFSKRYFSRRSFNGQEENPSLSILEDGKQKSVVMPLLAFDPSWNPYYSTTSPVEEDMAAMFVPNDETMRKYFLEGAGRTFIERYSDKPNNAEDLMYNVDQIPLDIVQALINNLMKPSFNESVPSKYLSIKNDARDDMFSHIKTESDFKSSIDTVLLANNGALYVTNTMFTPAAYAAVSAPVLFGENTKIMNAIITADDNFIEGDQYSSAPLKQYFSTYLKSMQSNFSLLIPSDSALQFYVDPVTYATPNKRFGFKFEYKSEVKDRTLNNKSALPIKMTAFKYDVLTGEKGLGVVSLAQYAGNTANAYNIQNQLLTNLLNEHLIIHDADQNKTSDLRINANEREFYFSRAGSPIHIKSFNNGKAGMQIEGGFQMQFNQELPEATPKISNVLEVYDQTEKSNGYGNGMTYIIDAPMQSSMHSVYNNITEGTFKDDFSEFAALCNGYADTIITRSGLVNNVSNIDQEKNKYRIFSLETKTADQTVRFFNNYNYTVYIPTNEAVKAAIENGLPTWESIGKFIYDHRIVSEEATADSLYLAKADQAKAQAMVTTLVNFIKYHFQDRSIFDDIAKLPTSEFSTSSYDKTTNSFIKLTASSSGKGNMTITDIAGKTVSVITPNNIFARDMIFNAPRATANTINSSSYSVLHQIDGYLNFLPNGQRFDAAWSTPSAARRFVERYIIR